MKKILSCCVLGLSVVMIGILVIFVSVFSVMIRGIWNAADHIVHLLDGN